jgi:predicted Zn-dependent protease with MMP-like domain
VLSAAEFDRLVEAALRDIPKRFRRRLENVAIIVEQEPPRPGLLGLYQGHPLTSRSVFQDDQGLPRSGSWAVPARCHGIDPIGARL